MIRRLTLIALPAILVLALASGPPAAQAQMASIRGFPTSVGVGVWLTSASTTAAGPVGTWQTTFVTLDTRTRFGDSPWALYTRYGTGTPGNFGGSFAGATGGRESLWSTDFSYLIHKENAGFRLFAGYGTQHLETTLPAPAGATSVDISGFRIGVEAGITLAETSSGGKWSADARFVLKPSNSVTVTSGGATTAVTRQGTEWAVAIRYKFPSPTHMSAPPGTYLATLKQVEFDPSWAAAVEYRTVSFDGSSQSGVYVGVSKTF